MPNKQAKPQKSTDWRRRYIRQGDELDEVKARYKEHVELLQKLVSRLSLVSDDSDETLVKEVQDLRAQLKGQDTELDGLSETLIRFDNILRSQQGSSPTRRIKSASRKLHKEVKSRGNVWRRLKSRLRKVASRKIKHEYEETLDEREQMQELPSKEELRRVLEATPGYGVIASKVSDTLKALLSQLTFPDSAQRDLEALHLRIDSRVNWYELAPTLEDLSNLVLAAVGKGQRQFHAFLTELDEQLKNVQVFLSAQGQYDENWSALNQNLRSLLQSQSEDLVQKTAMSIDNPQVAEALKQSIVEHISKITKATGEAMQQGESLKDQLQPQVQVLRERLQLMDIEHKELRKQLQQERKSALSDILTGLPSREAFDERVEFEYERWRRYQKSTLLIAAGVDNFSMINERFGHMSGDRALQIVAKEIKQRIRTTDFIARYGGEEFVFIFPVTELEPGIQVVEKLRKVMARLPFHFRDQRLQLTMSFGIVAFSDVSSPHDLLARAELALNNARAKGRNCVKVWQENEN